MLKCIGLNNAIFLFFLDYALTFTFLGENHNIKNSLVESVILWKIKCLVFKTFGFHPKNGGK